MSNEPTPWTDLQRRRLAAMDRIAELDWTPRWTESVERALTALLFYCIALEAALCQRGGEQ